MIDDVMYGMIPSANTANWVMRAAGEQLEEAEHAALVGLALQVLERTEVDARHREVGPEPVERRSSAR